MGKKVLDLRVVLCNVVGGCFAVVYLHHINKNTSSILTLQNFHTMSSFPIYTIYNKMSSWETARHMDRPAVIRTNPVTGLVDTDLGDWCILQLGTITAQVERLEIDTRHFKGNFPESILVEAGCARNTNETVHDDNEDQDDVNFDDLTIHWFPLLNRTKLGPDKNYVFELMEEDDDGGQGDGDVEDDDEDGGGEGNDNNRPMGRSSSQPRLNPPYVDAPYISHIRVFIYPDGGISRVRVFGRPKRMDRGMRRVLSGLQM